MNNTLIEKIQRKAHQWVTPSTDRFLSSVKGVIHVGANAGQEKESYKKRKIKVIWIEPIPHVFQALLSNIQDAPEQKAYQYLITDEDNKEYTFHIANNFGASSSILEFADHKKIWPEVAFERSINLKSITLSRMIEKEKINMKDYDALVLDTQGSELLVLKGAASLLTYFKYIKTEAPDFEAYSNCCKLNELTDFLKTYHFKECRRYKFARHESAGSYYDVIYKKIKATT